MHGGVFAALELCKRFKFPHEFEYVHATRYRGDTRGSDLVWRSSRARRSRAAPCSSSTISSITARRCARSAPSSSESVSRKRSARFSSSSGWHASARGRSATVTVSSRRRVRVRQRHGLPRLLARLARHLRRGGRCSVTELGLIVGSGFEQLGFEVLTRSPTKTPYGEPSGPCSRSRFAGCGSRASRGTVRATAWRRTRSTIAPISGHRATRRTCMHRRQHGRRDRSEVIPR